MLTMLQINSLCQKKRNPIYHYEINTQHSTEQRTGHYLTN